MTEQSGPGAVEPVEAAGNAIENDEEAAIRAEIEKALASDVTVLGEVYRGLRDGLSDEELRVQRGAENPNFVWNYRRTIRALVEGDLPSAPSVASQTASRFRKLLRTDEFQTRLGNDWSSDWRSSSLASVIQTPKRPRNTRHWPPLRPRRSTQNRAFTYTRSRTTYAIHMTRSGSTRFSRSATAAARSFSDSERRSEKPYFRRNQSSCVSTRRGRGQRANRAEVPRPSGCGRSYAKGRQGSRPGMVPHDDKFLDQIAVTLNLPVRAVFDPESLA